MIEDKNIGLFTIVVGFKTGSVVNAPAGQNDIRPSFADPINGIAALRFSPKRSQYHPRKNHQKDGDEQEQAVNGKEKTKESHHE